MLPGMFQGKTRRRRVPVPEALEYLTQEESQKLIDMDTVARAAIQRVEQAGIIFVDEIDKIAGREGGHGPDVSREGVQRDILPIVEGTTVNTKHGMVRTDHILFIAAGAFHVSKPSDLIPELQGRFPIRVELDALGRDEFVRILTEPRSALIKQYTALMETEGVTLEFTPDAIERIAELATIVNERTENIGARRLHTVMERLLDRDLVRRAGARRADGPDRRRVRRSHAGGHRPERRSVAVHPVIASSRARRSGRRAGWCCRGRAPAENRARRCRRCARCRGASPTPRFSGSTTASRFASRCRPRTPTARRRRRSSASRSTGSPSPRPRRRRRSRS